MVSVRGIIASVICCGGGKQTENVLTVLGTRVILEVTSGELLAKRTKRKCIFIIYKRNTYKLMLLLDIVTAGIQSLSYRGISCLCLNSDTFDTSPQLLITVEVLCR
jgi:hypothetical protein